MAHTWVLLLGVIAICAYADMAGRIAAITGRAVFDLIRERLGARTALVNLAASYLVTVITLAAELGGVALALRLAVGLAGQRSVRTACRTFGRCSAGRARSGCGSAAGSAGCWC
ncbi:divalent metal cation transporter [Micromonospora sp. LOL_024]|uniref:divalent metal cation transporter n=1 Tax=Micromonospora sp. LOL_024 TaxID=3345412 RepID=UPI003A8B4E19